MISNLPSTQIELPPLRDYIAGNFSEPSERLGTMLENPNTGQPLAEQRATSDDGLEVALQTAWETHQAGTWANMPIEERVETLARLSAELDKRKERIAQLDALNTGVTIRFTSMLNIIVTGAWHLANEQLKGGWTHTSMPGTNDNQMQVYRKPWGPALLLVAWNAPSTFMAHKGASSLAAGCPTILKPTEWAPYGCDIFGEAAQAAGLPPGAFQIVHGGAEVGAKLVADNRIKAISFTGGLAGGRSIAVECAKTFKPAQLEMGGNNPVIVLPDADLDEAAAGIVSLMSSLNGQWCRALGRLIVPEMMQDALLARVMAQFSQINIGDSLDMATDMGPMMHSSHLAQLQNRLDALTAAGGALHSNSTLPDYGGSFIAPTLVTGVDSAQAQHEIFGPIGTVHTYTTEAEMLALANDTPYGLEAYLFTKDEEKGLQLGQYIQAGEVKVNGPSILSLGIMTPRPAWGLSGMNDEGTAETFRFFCNTRVVGVEGPLQF
ncbi:MAG: aldehyde dehydrogenase [Chloroflexi bacterium]|nr:aldehyde dehydrogenase [Chloroflexota bacterium]